MHRQIEIFYVLDGIIEITIAGQKKQLKKGMTSIAFPNMVHATHTLDHSSAIMMIFNDDLLPDFYNEFHMQKPSSPFITQLQDPEQFYFQVSKFLEQVQKNTDIRFSKDICILCLYDIVSSHTGKARCSLRWYLPEHFQLFESAFYRRIESVSACRCPWLQQISYFTYF